MKIYDTFWPGVVIMAVIALALLSGCAGLSEATGTDFAQRCAGYRATVASLKLLPPNEDRLRRIEALEEWLTFCPPLAS